MNANLPTRRHACLPRDFTNPSVEMRSVSEHYESDATEDTIEKEVDTNDDRRISSPSTDEPFQGGVYIHQTSCPATPSLNFLKIKANVEKAGINKATAHPLFSQSFFPASYDPKDSPDSGIDYQLPIPSPHPRPWSEHPGQRTCIKWANGVKCAPGTCLRPHFYFPTVVWRAHRDGVKTETCSSWKEGEILKQIEDMDGFESDEYKTGSMSHHAEDHDSNESQEAPVLSPSGSSKVRSPCAFLPGLCGYAHEEEDSTELQRYASFVKNLDKLPYRAKLMLECKKCEGQFEDVHEMMAHVEICGEEEKMTPERREKLRKMEGGMWR